MTNVTYKHCWACILCFSIICIIASVILFSGRLDRYAESIAANVFPVDNSTASQHQVVLSRLKQTKLLNIGNNTLKNASITVGKSSATIENGDTSITLASIDNVDTNEHLRANLVIATKIAIYALTAFTVFFFIVHFSYRSWKDRTTKELELAVETNALKSFSQTLLSIEKSICRSYFLGYLSFGLVCVIFVVLTALVYSLFEGTLSTIANLDTADTPKAVVFVIAIVLRTSLLGGFIIGAMMYAFKFAKSSFDQAVRFNKRKAWNVVLRGVVCGHEQSGRFLRLRTTSVRQLRKDQLRSGEAAGERSSSLHPHRA